MSEEDRVYGNGIVAGTGEYGLEATVDELYELIQEERQVAPGNKYIKTQVEGRENKSLGPPPSISPENLAQARWGIIWPPEPLTEGEKEIQAALQPLIDHRRQQMGGKEPHQFHYQDGWAHDDFLWEEGREIEPGIMVPDIVPYYLCIAASPERVPWEFQQYLDGEYAVGRLWFDDPADCTSYVEHLLAYEAPGAVPATGREVLFFGPENDGDRPTQQSAAHLVKPLYDWLVDDSGLNYRSSLLLGNQRKGAEAFRTHLLQRLEGQSLEGHSLAPPSLLFTACHGMEYGKPSGDTEEETEEQDKLQRATQGALLCQDWPGRPVGFVIDPEPGHYLAAAQIEEKLKLAGMMAFGFACFSAGTPLMEDWIHPTRLRSPKEIALEPFVARLPQKMLAGGLLAFVGHVSRAWDLSFLGIQGQGNLLGAFSEPMGELLKGLPVGHATDYLNGRWAHLTVLIDQQLADEQKYGRRRVVATWKARNDCRGYAILGDPAARLRAESIKP